MTKTKLRSLSGRYLSALQRHLKPGIQASLRAASHLGREAAALGLETLEMARMHEQALNTLELTGVRNEMIERAEIFFTEAIAPIIETHRAAREGKSQLKRLKETLVRRTEELAATNRQLHEGIARRKKVEAALKKSSAHYTGLLKESRKLQEGLRRLTYRVLAAQEHQRRSISRELQDEIAQTLLGINVRLLSLKEEARKNTKGLRTEIASTQRLVEKSAHSVRRTARGFENT
jgi:signal transduction histidine kinase